MDSRLKTIPLLLAALASAAPAAAGWARPSPLEQAQSGENARAVVLSWPEDSRLMALRLLDDLGAPDEVLTRSLTWFGKRPFSRVVVYADRAASNRPGIFLQEVSYYAPKAKAPALAAFAHGISYDSDREKLLACSDALETNLLALNLADDIVFSRRTVGEAIEFYDQTLRRYNAGAGSSYLRRLLFPPLPETP